MMPREEDAWDMARLFIGQFAVGTEDGEDDVKYFGTAIYDASLSIRAVGLPPTGSAADVPVTVVLRCRIPPSFTNMAGNLHGGAAATMFDNFNSTALAVWARCCAPSEDLALRWLRTGVSRTLNVSYLRPVPVGQEVDVENEVVSVGRNLALVRGRMTRVSDGKVICTSEHHKASTGPVERL